MSSKQKGNAVRIVGALLLVGLGTITLETLGSMATYLYSVAVAIGMAIFWSRHEDNAERLGGRMRWTLTFVLWPLAALIVGTISLSFHESISVTIWRAGGVFVLGLVLSTIEWLTYSRRMRRLFSRFFDQGCRYG
jgi:hypothetical protein